MKKLLIIPLIFVFSNLYSQQSFIGKTKEEVREFWSLEVSSDYFDEGTYDNDPTTDWFIICNGCVTNPEFSADFVDGICIYNSYKVESKNLSVYIARFNKQFKYSETESGWVDEASNSIWKIEGSSGNHLLAVSKL